MTNEWRQGRRVPHHLYEQRGVEPSNAPWPEGDPPLATFLDPDKAKQACDAVNGAARVQQQLDDLRHLTALLLFKLGGNATFDVDELEEFDSENLQLITTVDQEAMKVHVRFKEE